MAQKSKSTDLLYSFFFPPLQALTPLLTIIYKLFQIPQPSSNNLLSILTSDDSRTMVRDITMDLMDNYLSMLLLAFKRAGLFEALVNVSFFFFFFFFFLERKKKKRNKNERRKRKKRRKKRKRKEKEKKGKKTIEHNENF